MAFVDDDRQNEMGHPYQRLLDDRQNDMDQPHQT